jgi:hypothetical protein
LEVLEGGVVGLLWLKEALGASVALLILLWWWLLTHRNVESNHEGLDDTVHNSLSIDVIPKFVQDTLAIDFTNLSCIDGLPLGVHETAVSRTR